MAASQPESAASSQAPRLANDAMSSEQQASHAGISPVLFDVVDTHELMQIIGGTFYGEYDAEEQDAGCEGVGMHSGLPASQALRERGPAHGLRREDDTEDYTEPHPVDTNFPVPVGDQADDAAHTPFGMAGAYPPGATAASSHQQPS